MTEIERRDFDFFRGDILPDVHFGPVAQREDAKMFPVMKPSVKDVPKFGPLIFRVPLAELVPMRKEAFLGPCFFLVPARSADGGVGAEFLQRVEEGDGLEPVPARVDALFLSATSLV